MNNNYQQVVSLKLSDSIATKNNPNLINDVISSYTLPTNTGNLLSIGGFQMIKFSGTFEDTGSSEKTFEFYVLSSLN